MVRQAHITIQLINKLGGISIGHVPYRITSQAPPDLASGDLELRSICSDLRAGSRVGNVFAAWPSPAGKRLPESPDVRTADEFGLPGFEANGWSALFGPAGMWPDIVDKINEGVNVFLEARLADEQWQLPGLDM